MENSYLDLIGKAVGEGSDRMAWFESFLYRSGNPDLEDLIDSVDDSDYSLADWVEALHAFDEYLSSNNVQARDFSKMLGYLRCCVLMPTGIAKNPSLQGIVNQCLMDFGFDAVRPVEESEEG